MAVLAEVAAASEVWLEVEAEAASDSGSEAFIDDYDDVATCDANCAASRVCL